MSMCCVFNKLLGVFDSYKWMDTLLGPTQKAEMMICIRRESTKQAFKKYWRIGTIHAYIMVRVSTCYLWASHKFLPQSSTISCFRRKRRQPFSEERSLPSLSRRRKRSRTMFVPTKGSTSMCFCVASAWLLHVSLAFFWFSAQMEEKWFFLLEATDNSFAMEKRDHPKLQTYKGEYFRHFFNCFLTVVSSKVYFLPLSEQKLNTVFQIRAISNTFKKQENERNNVGSHEGEHFHLFFCFFCLIFACKCYDFHIWLHFRLIDAHFLC